MSVCNIQKLQMFWSQYGFETMKKTWSASRLEKDEKLLQEAFAQAARVPALKEAMNWAEAHGIKFFIDRRAMNCGGYYMPGTGVVAIAERATRSLQDFVRVIVHETRHAWQDYHGLLRRDYYSFTDYFIKNALIEADAYAFEKRAEDEYNLAYLKGLRKSLPLIKALSMLEGSLANKENYLAEKFLGWFSTIRPRLYGDAASKRCGQFWNLYSGPFEEIGGELRGFSVARGPGLDLGNLQNVLKLGKTFSGKNYLSKLAPEILSKKILAPSLAASFYEAANDDQKKLTAAIRKRNLARKKIKLLPKGTSNVRL